MLDTGQGPSYAFILWNENIILQAALSKYQEFIIHAKTNLEMKINSNNINKIQKSF